MPPSCARSRRSRSLTKLDHRLSHSYWQAPADIDKLRSHGYRDEEIFDVAAAAAARCFFSKLLDALGVQADSTFNDLDPALRQALTVGRPVAERPE